jgi:predicted nuclease with TOPRIM domain
MLKKVQKADNKLNGTYQESSEEDFKELFARQGRLEYDLSKLEGELYSLETHLDAAPDSEIVSHELDAEMDRLLQQMNRLLKE